MTAVTVRFVAALLRPPRLTCETWKPAVPRAESVVRSFLDSVTVHLTIWLWCHSAVFSSLTAAHVGFDRPDLCQRWRDRWRRLDLANFCRSGRYHYCSVRRFDARRTGRNLRDATDCDVPTTKDFYNLWMHHKRFRRCDNSFHLSAIFCGNFSKGSDSNSTNLNFYIHIESVVAGNIFCFKR